MIQNKPDRKPIGERNGIKIYSKLKAKTHLKYKTTRQKILDDLWSEITEKKIKLLDNRCEWCGRLGQRNNTANFLSGHHIIKRSHGRIDTLENCYIAHWISCHQFIEQKNIDVQKYPDKIAWEKRNETINDK
jgi:hypothetical protein